jgi:transcriptional regulator with XRE-family HTH domain
MIARIFWNNVKAQIKANRTTQKAVAESCGILINTFQCWIARGIIPGTVDTYNIAITLGVTIEYLLTGKKGKTSAEISDARSLLKKLDEKLSKIENRPL